MRRRTGLHHDKGADGASSYSFTEAITLRERQTLSVWSLRHPTVSPPVCHCPAWAGAGSGGFLGWTARCVASYDRRSPIAVVVDERVKRQRNAQDWGSAFQDRGIASQQQDGSWAVGKLCLPVVLGAGKQAGEFSVWGDALWTVPAE